jgi:hypothetical protein
MPRRNSLLLTDSMPRRPPSWRPETPRDRHTTKVVSVTGPRCLSGPPTIEAPNAAAPKGPCASHQRINAAAPEECDTTWIPTLARTSSCRLDPSHVRSPSRPLPGRRAGYRLGPCRTRGQVGRRRIRPTTPQYRSRAPSSPEARRKKEVAPPPPSSVASSGCSRGHLRRWHGGGGRELGWRRRLGLGAPQVACG